MTDAIPKLKASAANPQRSVLFPRRRGPLILEPQGNQKPVRRRLDAGPGSGRIPKAIRHFTLPREGLMSDALISEQSPLIRAFYERLPEQTETGRRRLGRPLTLGEKILCAHAEQLKPAPIRGETFIKFRADRVAMQDVTAQMAILEFMLAARERVAIPTTVHCDHLIRARAGAEKDLSDAINTHREVYDFLETAAARFGIGFWKPGAGIIHQVILENYAFPGGMLIGTESHTPHAGGLGMAAIGVGGAEAAGVMAGLPLVLRWPKLTAVHLTGTLHGWASPKDIILTVAEILTVKGGTGQIVEYIGPGARSLSATGKATIANMSAEIGATCSLFGFDEKMIRFLEATGRSETAALAREAALHLRPDPEVESDPHRFYDQVIELDLDPLEPRVVGPHTPDLGRPVDRWTEDIAANGWPVELSAGLIGSCTNTSYEDLGRAADVARQALAQRVMAKVPLFLILGSDVIFATAERDGLLEPLRQIGAAVLANACGPCIGQWSREGISKERPNSILTSFNRNSPRCNDGSPNTHAFIASPEVVIAYALAGRLDTDPLHQPIDERLHLAPPEAAELPTAGFEAQRGGFVAPPADGCSVSIAVRGDSERLQLLTPFERWDGQDLLGLAILLKAKGKCTTDHISPAGGWLKFRGHLDRISDNLFTGAINAFSPEPGTAISQIDGRSMPIPMLARAYKAAGIGWAVIGDENYGEGSSREQAALSPRHLGCRVVLARSFARAHEANLKRQGILALTFSHPADWEKIGKNDKLSVPGLGKWASGKPLKVVIRHPNGKEEKLEARHSFTKEEIEWFRAGSALNTLHRG